MYLYADYNILLCAVRFFFTRIDDGRDEKKNLSFPNTRHILYAYIQSVPSV